MTGHDVIDLGKVRGLRRRRHHLHRHRPRRHALRHQHRRHREAGAGAAHPVIASGGCQPRRHQGSAPSRTRASPVPSPAVPSMMARSISPRRRKLADEAGKISPAFMLAKRIIPCLDVTAGPRRQRASISSICAMPAIRSRSPAATTRRAPTSDLPRHHGQFRPARHHPAHRRGLRRAGLHPAHRRRRRARHRRCAPPAQCRRRQGEHEHRRGAEPDLVAERRQGRQPVHRRRHRRQTGRAGRWEVFTHGGRKRPGM